MPLARKRRRIGPALTTAAVAAGPPALAVLRPRTRVRDASLYFLQMWAFTVAHELPYDDPEAARRRLRIKYPIKIDTAIGRGELPNVRLQRTLSGLGRGNLLDRALSYVHWAWFIEPHATVCWILARHPEHFARAARQTAAVYDIGCATYFAVPTAPPWWASENGYTDGKVRRIMLEVGEDTWGRAWPTLYGSLGGNPWAAMPSLHFGSSLMAAFLLAETGPIEGAIGFAYSAVLGFALVYLGEHYVTDLIAGALTVFVVRAGEPPLEPAALAVSRGFQRLERIANE